MLFLILFYLLIIVVCDDLIGHCDSSSDDGSCERGGGAVENLPSEESVSEGLADDAPSSEEPLARLVRISKNGLLDELEEWLSLEDNLNLLKIKEGSEDAEESKRAGAAALYASAFAGSVHLIETLLALGVDADAAALDDDKLQTPLIVSVYAGHSSAALALLEGGARPDSANQHGATALHLAALNGGVSGMKELALELLTRGSDPNAVDASSFTPLHMAALSSTPSLVEALLEAGADPFVLDEDQRSPLHHVCGGRPPEEPDRDRPLGVLHSAQALVERAPELVRGRDVTSAQPLHWCAARNHNLTTLYLVKEAGAEIDSRDAEGRTALFRAFLAQSSWSAKVLLEDLAASPLIADNDGDTVVHWAARNSFSGLLGLLLERGGGQALNALNLRSGNTPLHEAAAAGCADCFEQFLLAADRGGFALPINEPNARGESPALLAARHGELGGARVLWILRSYIVERLGRGMNEVELRKDPVVTAALQAVAVGAAPVRSLTPPGAATHRQTAQAQAKRRRREVEKRLDDDNDDGDGLDSSELDDFVDVWQSSLTADAPLLAACEGPDERALIVLLSYNAESLIGSFSDDRKTGDTVLHRCVSQLNVGAVKWLLAEESRELMDPAPSPTMTNKVGVSPLDLVQEFIDAGTVDDGEQKGSDPALRRKTEEIIEIFASID